MAAAVNSKGNKSLLANDVNTLFINGKATLVNGERKLSSHLLWLYFLIVLFNIISLFYEDLISFKIINFSTNNFWTLKPWTDFSFFQIY